MSGRFSRGRHTGVASPYRFTRTRGGGWRIGWSVSSFLVAEGSGWSVPKGMQIYRQLEDDWHKRKKPDRPKGR